MASAWKLNVRNEVALPCVCAAVPSAVSLQKPQLWTYAALPLRKPGRQTWGELPCEVSFSLKKPNLVVACEVHWHFLGRVGPVYSRHYCNSILPVGNPIQILQQRSFHPQTLMVRGSCILHFYCVTNDVRFDK